MSQSRTTAADQMETSFGFSTVNEGEKQPLVNDVFHKVASRYDIMNDLMSAGMHRLWKDAMISSLAPPKNDTKVWKSLDVAGGTGDIAFRIVEHGGSQVHTTVFDINGSMLEVGEQRAIKKGLADKLTFIEGNAEVLPFEDNSFDAYTIAFGIRNVPKMEQAIGEAYRVLKPGGKFMCLEFSEVNVPLLDKFYEQWSMNAIPKIGKAVTGDGDSYQYLVESIAKFPNQEKFADAIRRQGFEKVSWRDFTGGWVLAREGVVSELPSDALPPPAKFAHRIARLLARRQAADRKQSERLSIALNKLGPSWIKLGQFLATRPDVVGSATALDLSLLHDSLEPFGLDEAKSRIEQSINRPIDEIYTDISEPIAAASVAQVHKATLKDTGETVAIKVIRPGVRARFRKDIETFYTAARFVDRTVEEAKRLKPVSVVDMLDQSAKIEMDLRLEAAAFSEMGENIKEDEGFKVPEVNWEYTGRDCITMTWVDGIKLSDVDALREAGHDLEALSVTLIQSFLKHTLRDGFFHADMHPGNLFVDPKGDVVAC
ncbi:Ubiquinone/menaquinone biosynthesis C-methyltransferase UbiE [Nymphon striatum]|nr:Ubiquinone/menaquinone biosynthesis C-methyltransferase UbiE [Nymphon striatum]